MNPSDREELWDMIKNLEAENKQQADFLSLAKEEMDSLQAENAELKKFIADNEIVLKSANTDVKSMSKYATGLEQKVVRLKEIGVLYKAADDFEQALKEK